MAMIPYYSRSIAGSPEIPMWGDDFFRSFFMNREPWAEAFRVDIRDLGDRFVLEAELPGMTREQVHIDIEDDVLSISCESDAVPRDEQGSFVYSERRWGRVQRSFTLTQVKEDEITAEYRDGVLRVTLPKEKSEEKKRRRIDVG